MLPDTVLAKIVFYLGVVLALTVVACFWDIIAGLIYVQNIFEKISCFLLISLISHKSLHKGAFYRLGLFLTLNSLDRMLINYKIGSDKTSNFPAFEASTGYNFIIHLMQVYLTISLLTTKEYMR